MNEANIYLVDNVTLKEIKIIDNFVSFIWTDRYNDYGDFELVLPEEDFDPDVYKEERLISINDSDRYMIIETIIFDDFKESAREDKKTYTIKGRGVETLLERRVVSKPYFTNIHGSPVDTGNTRNIGTDIDALIYTYFNNNDDLALRTSAFKYMLTTDPYPGGGTYGEANNLPSDLSYRPKSSGFDYMGQTVGQAVWDLCKYVNPITDWPSSWGGKWPDESDSNNKKYNLSLKMYKGQIWQGNIETGYYVDQLFLVLYAGIDRTYSQSKRSVVEFSEFMDNIGGYSYSESDVDWKNVAIVRGNFIIPTDDNNYEDNYIYRTVKTNPSLNRWGSYDYMNSIDYRCLFVDSNIERRKRDSDGNITDELYTYNEFVAMMNQAGYEALYNYQSKPDYSVELLDYGRYRYGKDYFLGDLVAVKLNNGKMTKARIIEVIRSWDNTGYSIFPRFELIQD